MALVDAIALLDPEQGAKALATLATELGFAADDIYVRSSPVPLARQLQVMPLPSGPVAPAGSTFGENTSAEGAPLLTAAALPQARRAGMMSYPSDPISAPNLPLARSAGVMPLPLPSSNFPPVQLVDGATFQPSALDYVSESVKGAVAGGKGMIASSLRGAAGLDPVEAMAANVQPFLHDLQRVRRMAPLEIRDLRRRIDHEPPATRMALHSAVSDLLDGSMRPEDVVKIFRPPTPMQQRTLHRVGQAVDEFGKEMLQAGASFEGSWTRDISAAAGSLVVGLGLSLLNPKAATLLFVTSGSGESVDRAIKTGATEDQIRRAAVFGTAAGATDVVDALLPALGSTGRVAGFIKAVGLAAIKGAFAEGGQEGLQELMQNAIARNIYRPDQDLSENVARSAIIASIIGAGTSGGARTVEPMMSGGEMQVRIPRPESISINPAEIARQVLQPTMAKNLSDYSELVDPPVDHAEARDFSQPSLPHGQDLYPATSESRVHREHPKVREKLEGSPYHGVPITHWAEVTERLIGAHPLSADEIVNAVYQAWKGAPKGAGARTISNFLHETLPRKLETLAKTRWRGEESRLDKDLVFQGDPKFSIEIKVTTHDRRIPGNKAHALGEPGGEKTKVKSGYYLIIRHRQGKITEIGFGWLDHGDWSTSPTEKSQSAYMPVAHIDNQIKLLNLPGGPIDPWPHAVRRPPVNPLSDAKPENITTGPTRRELLYLPKFKPKGR
jgi:hypothetical protein